MINLIDTHIHFDDNRFDVDREAVYARAQTAGVTQMVVPATTQARWSRIVKLSRQYQGVYATAGLHPVFIEQHTENHITALPDALTQGHCVAVGECGLDGFIKNTDMEQQKYFFTRQLQIAEELKLPVIVHARNATEAAIQLIKKTKTTGVVHSYNGSLEQATQLLDLGYLLSFGGAVTYDRATRLRKVVAALPKSGIMIETDAPDQPDSSHNGLRNEPAYLPEVLTSIASLLNVTPQVLADHSNNNAQRLFGL